jgi:hypothetical protein
MCEESASEIIQYKPFFSLQNLKEKTNISQVVKDGIEEDLKRLDEIDSLEEDIKNHYKTFKGKVDEINSQYQVPLVDPIYADKIENPDGENFEIYFFKDRWGTQKPDLSPSEGIRIVFGVITEQDNPKALIYVPYLVYRATEEGEMYPINGNKYPLTKDGIKKIIKSKK